MFNAFQGEEHQPFYFEGNNGGAVLLTHGFPGSPKEMRYVAQTLNEMGWTTRGILLPGFGPEIAKMADKTHEDWTNTVESALLQLKRDHKTVLTVGNSMGGSLTIQAVTKHGAAGIILFAPFYKVDHFLWGALPILKHVIPQVKPFKIFEPDFNDPDFQKGVRNFFPNADFTDPEFQKGTLEFEIHTNIIDNIRTVGATAYQLAPGIQVPTLIIQGMQDELVKPRVTHQLIDQLNGSVTYYEVMGQHDLMQPDRAAWQDITHYIRDFVQQFQPEKNT